MCVGHTLVLGWFACLPFECSCNPRTVMPAEVMGVLCALKGPVATQEEVRMRGCSANRRAGQDSGGRMEQMQLNHAAGC